MGTLQLIQQRLEENYKNRRKIAKIDPLILAFLLNIAKQLVEKCLAQNGDMHAFMKDRPIIGRFLVMRAVGQRQDRDACIECLVQTLEQTTKEETIAFNDEIDFLI